MTNVTGLKERDTWFKNRLKLTSVLCSYFHFSIADVDNLSIEELEYYFERREEEVKDYNQRIAKASK